MWSRQGYAGTLRAALVRELMVMGKCGPGTFPYSLTGQLRQWTVRAAARAVRSGRACKHSGAVVKGGFGAATLWLVRPNAQELDSRIAGYCDAGKSVVRAPTLQKVLGHDTQTLGMMAAQSLHGMPATLRRCSRLPKRTCWACLEPAPDGAAPRLLRWADAKKG